MTALSYRHQGGNTPLIGETIYPYLRRVADRYPDNEAVVSVPQRIRWTYSRFFVAPEELREYVRDGMAHFKVPRYVTIVEEFPMTVTGKIQKFKIRELVEKQLEVAS